MATGTHGSGDANQSLAAAVSALEMVGPDGELRRLARGEDDFDGCVVALGALGIITRLTLDIEPTYQIRRDVYTELPWAALESAFDEVTATAYSVSLFTDFATDHLDQVWLKSRSTGDVSKV